MKKRNHKLTLINTRQLSFNAFLEKNFKTSDMKRDIYYYIRSISHLPYINRALLYRNVKQYLLEYHPEHFIRTRDRSIILATERLINHGLDIYPTVHILTCVKNRTVCGDIASFGKWVMDNYLKQKKATITTIKENIIEQAEKVYPELSSAYSQSYTGNYHYIFQIDLMWYEDEKPSVEEVREIGDMVFTSEFVEMFFSSAVCIGRCFQHNKKWFEKMAKIREEANLPPID